MKILFTLVLAHMSSTLIYSLLAFINGRLVPSVLGGFYEAVPSHTLRTLLGTVIFATAANAFIALGYRLTNATIGGVSLAISTTTMMLVFAILLDNIRPTPLAYAGVFLTIMGGSLVVLSLQR